ncbi:hypothetical protein [uncultured Deinococcus sp.]|uniref:hypothetical protein n=1 Tax=uncultured Deinococcus sp. TaxID=158789 RepID=UPI0025DC5631|nr:hypothetical protein [uncultured Deinococcus sp.]
MSAGDRVQESKHDRFRRLAEQRVNRALKELRLIANLANRNNYDYTEEEVKILLSALEKELKATRSAFRATPREDFRL